MMSKIKVKQENVVRCCCRRNKCDKMGRGDTIWVQFLDTPGNDVMKDDRKVGECWWKTLAERG